MKTAVNVVRTNNFRSMYLQKVLYMFRMTWCCG